jgi:hemerythrin-like metal-binding protein
LGQYTIHISCERVCQWTSISLPPNAKMNLFNEVKDIWENHRLTLNLPLLDLQHLWLIFLTIVIEKDCNLDDLNKKKDSLLRVIQESERYSKIHFSIEEALIKRIDDLFEDHHGEHKIYLNRILQELKVIESIPDMDIRQTNILATNFHHYLRDWWLSHIAITDMNYKTVLNKSDNKDDILTQWINDIKNKKLLTILTIQKELYEAVMRHKLII